jgi:hypothetical protein
MQMRALFGVSGCVRVLTSIDLDSDSCMNDDDDAAEDARVTLEF